jgi:hypothetical protein
MINARHIFWLLALALVTAARADETTPDNPYGAIVSRNVFGLVPIPTNPPADTTPAVPPLKITPNGIMDIFGSLQALFKVAEPAKAGQPAHDESYVLGEGESQDDIEVTKIDKVAGVVTFNNHGVVQELPLVAGTASGGAAGGGSAGGGFGGGGSGGGPGNFTPSTAGMPGNNGGGRFGRNPNQPTGNAGATGQPNGTGGLPNFNSAGTAGPNKVLNSGNQEEEGLSPEAQVLMMEANRMKYKAAGSPMADLMPPTVLTEQANQGSGALPNP